MRVGWFEEEYQEEKRFSNVAASTSQHISNANLPNLSQGRHCKSTNELTCCQQSNPENSPSEYLKKISFQLIELTNVCKESFAKISMSHETSTNLKSAHPAPLTDDESNDPNESFNSVEEFVPELNLPSVNLN